MIVFRGVVCLCLVAGLTHGQSVVKLAAQSPQRTSVSKPAVNGQESPCGNPPRYEPAPGNVHDFGFQQTRLAARNIAFEETMPYVSCELALGGYVMEFSKIQSPDAGGWIYPAYFRAAITDTGKKPYTLDTVVVLYHYDQWQGSAKNLARQLASRHRWAKANPD